MVTTRYIISDAAKKVEVEPHVLRYWEEELELSIPRNEMGHRYYREEEIGLLKKIKRLKEEGFQLKAIKLLLMDTEQWNRFDMEHILKQKEAFNQRAFAWEEKEGVLETTDGTSINMVPGKKENGLKIEKNIHKQELEEKVHRFQMILYQSLEDVLQKNNQEMMKEMGCIVSEQVIKQMDYLLRLKEEREEERYKKLDEMMRSYQKTRGEVAATREKKQRKRRLFSKKRREKV